MVVVVMVVVVMVVVVVLVVMVLVVSVLVVMVLVVMVFAAGIPFSLFHLFHPIPTDGWPHIPNRGCIARHAGCSLASVLI